MGQTLGFEFDVTIAMWRTESIVESVTIALWQTWVELSLHVTDISTVEKVRFESPKTWITQHRMEPDCICANAAMCRTKKFMYFYGSNCDVQANISVAIARIVTDKEIRVLLLQKLWRTKVAISTSVTDWVLLSLLLGRKIMYKCCYSYTVTDTSRRLRDGQLNETSYCSTYFFSNLLSTFYGFLFPTLSKKCPEMLQLQPLWMHHCDIDVTIALMSVTNSMLLIYL